MTCGVMDIWNYRRGDGKGEDGSRYRKAAPKRQMINFKFGSDRLKNEAGFPK